MCVCVCVSRELHEGAVLLNLMMRFDRELIYVSPTFALALFVARMFIIIAPLFSYFFTVSINSINLICCLPSCFRPCSVYLSFNLSIPLNCSVFLAHSQTYIGSILVSVNPYKMYNIYGTDMVLQYKGHALGENPPWDLLITLMIIRVLTANLLKNRLLLSKEHDRSTSWSVTQQDQVKLILSIITSTAVVPNLWLPLYC